MRYCVRLLRSMASLGNEAINQDLFDQGAISQLLGNDRRNLPFWNITAIMDILISNASLTKDLCFSIILSTTFPVIIMQMEGSPEEEDVITLEIKADIQLILSALCENNPHRKVKLRSRTLITEGTVKRHTERYRHTAYAHKR